MTFVLFGIALLGTCIWLAPTIDWKTMGIIVVLAAFAIIWMGYDLLVSTLSKQQT
jgi:membrane protein implicated in regulation of membrane protease activity